MWVRSQISLWIGLCSDQWVYLSNNCSYYQTVVTDPDSPATTYTYIIYWSTLMLTTAGDVNHPVTVPEFIFVITEFLVGVLLFATIIGNVGEIITSMNSERATFEENMDGVKRYMTLRKVNKDLDKRVIRLANQTQPNLTSLLYYSNAFILNA